MKTVSCLVALCWLGSSLVNAALFNIPASKDNTLYEDSAGGISNGAGEYMFVGKTARNSIRRAVMVFDLSAVPAGAVVGSAALRLHVSKTISGAVPTALYRLTSDWGEGASDAGSRSGSGTRALAGDATWLHTFYDGQFWASPGGDFFDEPSAQRELNGEGFYVWGPTAPLAADVTLWLRTPSANFGWILISDEVDSPSAKRLDTRTHLDPARRPVLLLEAEVPLRFHTPMLVSNYLMMSFTAQAGQEYVVERRGELRAGSWFVLTNIAAAAVARTITLRQPLTTNEQFFRLVAP